MNYRSFQGMFAETSLEQKCRIWFGIALFVLVVGAFWCVDYIAEQLVHNATNEKGRDFADSIWLKFHWEKWETDPTRKDQLSEHIRDLLNQPYTYRIIALPGDPKLPNPPAKADDAKALHPPEDDWELAEIQKLSEQWRRHMQELQLLTKAPSVSPAYDPAKLPGELVPKKVWRRVDDESSGSSKEYFQYYQPVYWKESCIRCHRELLGAAGALSASDTPAVYAAGPPFRVVRVQIPYDDTRGSINATRAILITTGIVTVTLAMVALWLVVRYVVVKPLQHLRDVSDEVSRGNTDLRADVHTNDEFEELGEAFNRMLRSLVETQEQLRMANTELDGKVAELAQVNVQLYEMNRLKSDFLANMSHELRTPLNSIIGYSDVLQGVDALNAKQKRYCEHILTSGRQLLEIINDILDLAKMESGKMEVRPSEFRIESVVAAQCDLVRSLSEKKNIDLTVKIAPDLPPLFTDQKKVQQILTNLLSNAIKFTPEGGRITISAANDPQNRLELTVTDTGVGIAEEDREVIFEKFRQGRTTGGDNLTREYAGTGLGLSIVREICNLLGGDINFTSELGKGSAFTVRLPWTYSPPRPTSNLAARLDDLTRPRLADLASPPNLPVAGVGS